MAFVGFAIPRRIARIAPRRRRGRRRKRSRPSGEARLDQGAAEVVRDRTLLRKELNAALILRATRWPRASPRCGGNSPATMVSSYPKFASPTTSRPRRRPIRSKSTGPRSATQELRVKDMLVIFGDGPRPTARRRGARARLRHPGARNPRSVRQGGEARRLQDDRSDIGYSHPSQRGHPQQPRAAALL